MGMFAEAAVGVAAMNVDFGGFTNEPSGRDGGGRRGLLDEVGEVGDRAVVALYSRAGAAAMIASLGRGAF